MNQKEMYDIAKRYGRRLEEISTLKENGFLEGRNIEDIKHICQFANLTGISLYLAAKKCFIDTQKGD